MNEQDYQKLISTGLVIELPDYTFTLVFDETSYKQFVRARISKRAVDRDNNHYEFTREELQKLVEDLNDLSDWRHFKRLKNKLNA